MDGRHVVMGGHGLVTGRVDCLRTEMYLLATGWSRVGHEWMSERSVWAQGLP